MLYYVFDRIFLLFCQLKILMSDMSLSGCLAVTQVLGIFQPQSVATELLKKCAY